MLRYLKEAFWARPSLGSLGPIPWNAIVVAGAAVVGFGEHAVWLGALAAETFYLYALTTNARFQYWVDAKDVAALRSNDETERSQQRGTLAPASLSRVSQLESKITMIDSFYRDSRSEAFLFDSNRDALRKLADLYVRLLVAQRNISTVTGSSNATALEAQASQLRLELGRELPPALKESKEATLAIVVQRLEHVHRRAESLAEIESDLTRIEAQVDLALENASLKGKPAAISGNIGLVSRILVDDDLEDAAGAPTTSPS